MNEGGGGLTFDVTVWGLLSLSCQQAGQEQGVLSEHHVDGAQLHKPGVHGALWAI